MNTQYFQRLQPIKLNIAYYRKKSGLTQEDLADRINISRTHMSNIEASNMKIGPSLELLFEIADVLNVEIVKLFEVR